MRSVPKSVFGVAGADGGEDGGGDGETEISGQGEVVCETSTANAAVAESLILYTDSKR